jgi:hypothetical protein
MQTHVMCVLIFYRRSILLNDIVNQEPEQQKVMGTIRSMEENNVVIAWNLYRVDQAHLLLVHEPLLGIIHDVHIDLHQSS